MIDLIDSISLPRVIKTGAGVYVSAPSDGYSINGAASATSASGATSADSTANTANTDSTASSHDELKYGALAAAKAGGAQTYHNDRGPIKKDKTMRMLVPDVITACAVTVGKTESGSCVEPHISDVIARAFGVKTLADAMAVTGCPDEVCVMKTALNGPQSQLAAKQLRTRYKLPGPVGTELLSNFNIDFIMQQFAAACPGFYPCNFNMRDFEQYSYGCERNRFQQEIIGCEVRNSPDTLARVSLRELYAGRVLPCGKTRRYDTFGCVINTDSYKRNGKHWMALFVDMRKEPHSIEFFNSSGNLPQPEYARWMEKTRADLAELVADGIVSAPPVVTNVCRWRHQHSKSECGVYSLFYIWGRLQGVPVDWFQSTPVPDQLMFEFRRHLFVDEPTAAVSEITPMPGRSLASASKRPKEPAKLFSGTAPEPTRFTWADFVSKHSPAWE